MRHQLVQRIHIVCCVDLIAPRMVVQLLHIPVLLNLYTAQLNITIQYIFFAFIHAVLLLDFRCSVCLFADNNRLTSYKQHFVKCIDVVQELTAKLGWSLGI
jgi:hypothetical protein